MVLFSCAYVLIENGAILKHSHVVLWKQKVLLTYFAAEWYGLFEGHTEGRQWLGETVVSKEILEFYRDIAVISVYSVSSSTFLSHGKCCNCEKGRSRKW